MATRFRSAGYRESGPHRNRGDPRPRPFFSASSRSETYRRLDALRGKTIVNLFFEASTRTRVSFEIAAKRLGADTVSIAAQGSSVSKGESLVDTLNTLVAMRPNAIVMRHAASGAPHFLARHLQIPIVNAGDGTHEHPTQALLDARTILDRRNARRAARGHHRRHRAQPRGAIECPSAFEIRRGYRAVRTALAGAVANSRNSRPACGWPTK